jgi:hypothetical protein
MAECWLCGAITTQPLELTWLEGVVECSYCGIQMPLYQSALHKLRQHAGDATAVIEALPARQI